MRWPWTPKEPAQDDLDGRVAKLERQMTALTLEWHDISDKLLHRLQRQAKRDRDAAGKLLEGSPQAVSQAPSPSAGGGRFERLQAARARHAASRGMNGQA